MQTNAIGINYHSDDDKIWLSLLFSIILHIIVAVMFWFINEQLKKPKLHKVELDNILFLKRGDSLDKNDNTPGELPPSIADALETPPSPPTPPTPQKKPEPKVAENKPSKRAAIPNDKPEKQKKYQSLNEMTKPASQPNKAKDRATSRAISELYGREWGDLGSEEKDFITNNLRQIARITQGYLEYPQAAGYLGQQGENAVEFYLLPNGDIQGLRLVRGTSYKLLDNNSIELIKIAYKDYPRPSTRTLIRFYIRYKL